MNELGQRLRDLRESTKLSQTDLAKKINTRQSRISRFESGEEVPELETLIKFANFFNVSLDYLSGRTGDRMVHQHPKIDRKKYPDFTDQEFEILGIIQSIVDRIFMIGDLTGTIEAMARISDREELADEYKIMLAVVSKMALERHKEKTDQELGLLEKMVKNIEKK
jgi:transcriptional regulator with XRE-family HTH domain